MNVRSPHWTRPFTVADLPRLRQELRRQARQRGLDGDALDDLVSALNELLINAVRHGGGRGVVEMRRDGGTLICEISDDGPGFAGEAPSPAVQPPVDLPGGRGLWLAHHLTDGLTMRSGPDGVTARVTVTVTDHTGQEDESSPR
jgi:anti-sigma regulatory factor (Ser/Thr protein kinase)